MFYPLNIEVFIVAAEVNLPHGIAEGQNILAEGQSRLEEKVDRLEIKVDNLETEVKVLRSDVKIIKSYVAAFDDGLNDHEKHITALEKVAQA